METTTIAYLLPRDAAAACSVRARDLHATPLAGSAGVMAPATGTVVGSGGSFRDDDAKGLPPRGAPV